MKKSATCVRGSPQIAHGSRAGSCKAKRALSSPPRRSIDGASLGSKVRGRERRRKSDSSLPFTFLLGDPGPDHVPGRCATPAVLELSPARPPEKSGGAQEIGRRRLNNDLPT